MRPRGGTRTAGTILLVLLLGLTACDSGAAGGSGGEPSSSATAPGSAAASGGDAPVLDPAMAVDPPGPRTERLLPADILVFSQKPLSASVLRRLGRLKDVEAVEPMSLAQVTVENRALNVAAVHPASYRRFTEVRTANFQEAWDRVAGGELAIVPGLGRRLADERDFIKLGVSADAPTLHVGAFATQVPQVHAVVNEKWGEALGMRIGNAVLISTGTAAPAKVRPGVQRIVGSRASVQRLDIAARLGLDTTVRQTALLTGGSVAEVVGTFTYTVLGGGRIAPEQAWVDSHISTEPVPILGRMTCNRAMFPQLRAALQEIVDRGLADEIHPEQYAGCYYPRFIAGTTTLSNHSFGLAFDINVPGNLRGTVGEIDRRVVAIFEKWGFAWGGHWSYTDPMHFEMNRIVQPR
jgi:hypothetical protein